MDANAPILPLYSISLAPSITISSVRPSKLYLLSYLLTYILILEVLQLYRMLKKCQLKYIFTGYRTAHLQIYNWLMYTHILIQKILEGKNKTKQK